MRGRLTVGHRTLNPGMKVRFLPPQQMNKNLIYILSLILNILGTILLAIPLVKSKKNIDDDLIITKNGSPKQNEDDNKYYKTFGLLKNKKLVLWGLILLGLGFVFQLILTI